MHYYEKSKQLKSCPSYNEQNEFFKFFFSFLFKLLNYHFSLSRGKLEYFRYFCLEYDYPN